MACDLGPVRLRLNAAGALIGGSVAFVAGAAAANGSFWAAPAAPGLMIGAGVCAGLAAAALGEAIGAVDEVVRCASATGRDCSGVGGNLTRSIEALRIPVGALASGCLGAAAAAWVPWVAQPAMWVLLGALVAQGLLIPGVIGFAMALQGCVEQAVEPSPTPSPIN